MNKTKGANIMGDFFEEFGTKLTSVAKDIGKRTEDEIEVQKIKANIRSMERANHRDFADMGKFIYNKFMEQEVIDTELVVFCEEIEKRLEVIEKEQKMIEKIRGDI